MAEAAKRYLARGWPVLPLRARDKRPLIRWEDLQKERPAEGDIAEWFRCLPDANIGVVTGEISNLIVLDINPKHGGDASLERLQQRFGSLSATVEAVTGGGGRHLYFAHPGGLTRNRAGLVQGIDLRGDGGYVVAPPSIHPSGRPYAGFQDLALTRSRLLLSRVGSSRRGGRVSDARFTTGADWYVRVWLKGSAIQQSHRSLGICFGTASTLRSLLNSCWPGTACGVGLHLMTPKLLES
jgi:hypothetical protein